MHTSQDTYPRLTWGASCAELYRMMEATGYDTITGEKIDDMSDTPETDAARKERIRGGWEGVPGYFAAKLERERDEARKMAEFLQREALCHYDLPWETEKNNDKSN